jgi:hypothetical protein
MSGPARGKKTAEKSLADPKNDNISQGGSPLLQQAHRQAPYQSYRHESGPFRPIR